MPVKHTYISTNRPTNTVEAHTSIIRIFYIVHVEQYIGLFLYWGGRLNPQYKKRPMYWSIVHVGWAENIYQYILCTKMGIEQAALNMHGNR